LEYGGLRKRLVLTSKLVLASCSHVPRAAVHLTHDSCSIPIGQPYYWACISNVFLRGAWLITISPDSFGLTMNQETLLLLVAGLEVFRCVEHHPSVDITYTVHHVRC